MCLLVYWLISYFNLDQGDSDFKVTIKSPPGECCICIEDMELGDKKNVVVAQKCGHTIHLECIRQYRDFIKSSTHLCPLCKTTIKCKDLTRNIIYTSYS